MFGSCSGGATCLVFAPEEQHVRFLLRRSNMFVFAPEEQHVYSPQIPNLSRSVRSGMLTERAKAHGAPLERSAIGVVRL
jgi:hypothetical protein